MNELSQLITDLVAFRDKRNWKTFHTPENLAKSVSIEAAELLELFQWGESPTSERLADELADVLIYALYLAESVNMDPVEIIRAKMKRNDERFPPAVLNKTE